MRKAGYYAERKMTCIIFFPIPWSPSSPFLFFAGWWQRYSYRHWLSILPKIRKWCSLSNHRV